MTGQPGAIRVRHGIGRDQQGFRVIAEIAGVPYVIGPPYATELEAETACRELAATNRAAGDAAGTIVSHHDPAGPADMDNLVVALADLAGRCGADTFEIGNTGDDDTPDDQVTWWVSCRWRGTRLHVDGYRWPWEAFDAMAARLLSFGKCQHCHRTTVPVATPAERGSSGRRCRWARVGPRWIRGCEQLAATSSEVGSHG